jgi:TRAP-type C4-dicarboxylate transport system permease small subunit
MAGSRVVRNLELIPKIVVGGLVLGAIGTMLFGVIARYVLLPITDWMDVDPVNFFWVEEVGETALAWLTLIGAAIGVGERSHFALAILVHRFPPSVRRAIHYLNYVVIFAFSLLVAWLGYKLSVLNMTLTSPALEFSLAWVYAPAAVGGLLMAVYAVKAGLDPREHTIADVRE